MKTLLAKEVEQVGVVGGAEMKVNVQAERKWSEIGRNSETVFSPTDNRAKDYISLVRLLLWRALLLLLLSLYEIIVIIVIYWTDDNDYHYWNKIIWAIITHLLIY